MNPVVQNAASKLLLLFEFLRPRMHRIPYEFGCTHDELEIFNPHYPTKIPDELTDFLTLVLPKGYLDIGVLKTRAPKDLLHDQQESVPFEGNRKHGFFGLGWWTGDSDGDGWLYDLYNNQIYAVPLHHNDEPDREAIHELAYHEFKSLEEWVDFLFAECVRRGWMLGLKH